MKLQKKVAMMTLPVLLLSCSVILISTFAFHDHHHRKAFVGSIGLVASVAMYGSPLVVVVSTAVNFNMIGKQKMGKIHILLGRVNHLFLNPYI